MNLALWLTLLGIIVAAVGVVWRITSDVRSARREKQSQRQEITRERARVRPRLVPAGGSSTQASWKLYFRNAGGPIDGLRLVSVECPGNVRPRQHIGTGDKGEMVFESQPPIPHIVRVEYEDSLGHKDAMTIELQAAHTFEVLRYDSDEE